MLDVEGPPPLLTSAWVLPARDQQLFGCWGWDWTEGSALGALVGDLLDWSVEIDQKVDAEKKTQLESQKPYLGTYNIKIACTYIHHTCVHMHSTMYA